MRDGLSQDTRLNRLNALTAFSPIDNSIEVLLRQIEEISGFIQYYNLTNQSDGFFDQFIDEIKKIRHNQEHNKPDGNMEPSQALLLTFAHNLKSIIQKFNDRWQEEYISWYIDKILKVESKQLKPDYTWIQLLSNKSKINISKGTGFTSSESIAENKIIYKLVEDMEVNSINIAKAYAIYFEKNADVFPANIFGYPISFHKKDILSNPVDSSLFEKRNEKTIQSIGLQITSPSLLLCEGKRKVSINVQSENFSLVSFAQRRRIVHLIKDQIHKKEQSKREVKEDILIRIFSSIFFLKISTNEGWSQIESYNVKYNSNSLIIEFLLEDSFPQTTKCNNEIHCIETDFPSIKILLNHDAWLYPYSWLKDFFIKKIFIKTCVEGATNILFYNELGEIDTSKPFSPFGVNTEQGAWFVVGNYEMAVKNTQKMSLNIRWHQLPRCEGGLFEYYRSYNNNIDNLSFKIRPRYLSDYKWDNTNNQEFFYLFSTNIKERNGSPEALGKLSEESIIKDVCLENVNPINIEQEDYRYSILSKSGFFSFVLEDPEMGFGEKFHRELYSQLLINKALKKKGNNINIPLNPLIDRITLSYEAYDEIDVRTCYKNNNNFIYHIYPLGEKQVYPKKENKPISFVYNLDSEENILFGLENVEGEEYLNIYFDFFPHKEEVSLSKLPEVVWYWGDGYNWHLLPDESIIKNTTQNLLTNGLLKIYIPKLQDKNFKDKDGFVWLRASIVKNAHKVATISKIYTNVAKIIRSDFQLDKERQNEFVIDDSESKIPGILKVSQISPFIGGQIDENSQSKSLRMSEYITHREKALTIRDYERMALQAFSEIRKIKCFFDKNTKRVCLAIIPKYIEGMDYSKPFAFPELLLKVEEYFNARKASFAPLIDAIHPVYEEITVRCDVELSWVNYSQASSRALISRVINNLISPWQRNNDSPSFAYSFTLQDIHDKISSINQVINIKHISVIQMIKNNEGFYETKEYLNLKDEIKPSCEQAILIPSNEHIFVSKQDNHGIEEMKINENFIIWQGETEKL